jgi:hypothetical protein
MQIVINADMHVVYYNGFHCPQKSLPAITLSTHVHAKLVNDYCNFDILNGWIW